MTVTHFRARRPGPELDVEDAVIQQTRTLFPSVGPESCAFSSMRIGAGLPDLIYLGYEPAVTAISEIDTDAAQVLAYLRLIPRALLSTTAKRLGKPREEVSLWLEQLTEASAVNLSGGTYSIAPEWKRILPQVISIEAKVSDWKRAFDQAARNRIFSWKSYIAVPAALAKRLRYEPMFSNSGIGILSVTDHDVCIVKRARAGQPRVWRYYYQLAFIVARHLGVKNNGI